MRLGPHQRPQRAGAVLVVVAWTLVAGPTLGQVPESPAEATQDSRRAEAAAALARGTLLYRQQDYGGALAEFLRSRRLYPARGNTLNAALALRELGRYDEALEMFETLLRSFPEIEPQQTQQVLSAIQELRSRVGSVEIRIDEPGATVVISGRIRGITPLPHPLRVAIGAHLVRVVKAGHTPLEVRIEVASGETAVVEGKLLALRQLGTLRVVEQSGAKAQVLVDNVEVGSTPWQGTLGLGPHMVVLQAEGKLGTQPAAAMVRHNRETTLTLALEPLGCSLRVIPEPIGATVALDGVSLGNGLWEGPLRCGPHRLELGAPGFLSTRRRVVLGPKEQGQVRITLQRDPESELWSGLAKPRIGLEAAFAPAFSWSLGGQVADSCTDSCTKHLPLGFLLTLVGGYEFATGFGLGIQLGYAHVGQATFDRPIVAWRIPAATPLSGSVDDELLLQAAQLGVSFWYRQGTEIPWTVRLNGGVLLGSMRNQRTARFGGTIWNLPTQRADARYGFLNPEFRVGYAIGSGIDLSLVVQADILFAFDRPFWQQEGDLYHPDLGFVGFAQESESAPVLLLITPGVGAGFSWR